MERHKYLFDINNNGGGHGNANTIFGETDFFPRKKISVNVTSSDDGGCSGEMSSTYNVDSPGDKRMCSMPLASPDTQPENNLLAQYRFTRQGNLSDYTVQELTMEILTQQYETPKKGEIAFGRVFGVPLVYLERGDAPEDLSKLMSFRFPDLGLPLTGRNYGNLVISALELIHQDPEKGFETFRKIFSIEGEVVPITLTKHPVLCGELSNGAVIMGESNIGSRENHPDYAGQKLQRVFHNGSLNPRAAYLLRNSYLRVIAPGSTETSIKPVLATSGYTAALEEANELGGRTIVIPPVMNSEGTSYRDASEVIEGYLSYLDGKRGLVTDVILSATGIPPHGERRYAEYGQSKIEQDQKRCQVLLPQARIHLVEGLIEYDTLTGRVGHNPHKLGEALHNIWKAA